MGLTLLNFKDNMLFMSMLFAALTFELILENMGIMGSFLPNFIMSVVFSFAFHRPVKIWIVTLGVVIGESFFSTTPALMSILIIGSYFFISKILPTGGLKFRNFHIVVFILITMVVYSAKILFLYTYDMRPEVSLITIKMLVTIILFPLFYIITEKILKKV